MEAPSSDTRSSKRPWYFHAAMVLCFFFGAGGAIHGGGLLHEVGHPWRAVDPNVLEPFYKNPADRVAIAGKMDEFAEQIRVSHARVKPVAAVETVLGLMMLSLVASALLRRPAAVYRLRQVVVVQAVMLFVSLYALRPVNLVGQEVERIAAIANGSPARAAYRDHAWLAMRTLLAIFVFAALSTKVVRTADEVDEGDEDESADRMG